VCHVKEFIVRGVIVGVPIIQVCISISLHVQPDCLGTTHKNFLNSWVRGPRILH